MFNDGSSQKKIKGVNNLCILVKHEDYGNDFLYCAAQFAVVTSEGSEDDYIFQIQLLNHPTYLYDMVMMITIIMRMKRTTIFIMPGIMLKILLK